MLGDTRRAADHTWMRGRSPRSCGVRSPFGKSVEFARRPPRLEDVGVFGWAPEEKAVLVQPRVRVALAVVVAGGARLPPAGDHAGAFHDGVDPGCFCVERRLHLDAAVLQRPSNHPGDGAMLSMKQFGKPLTCRPCSVRTPSAHFSVRVRPSRPMTSKPVRCE